MLREQVFKKLLAILNIRKTRLILLLSCIKVVTLIYDTDFWNIPSENFSKDLIYNNFLINPDEIAIATVAYNYNQGLGYVSAVDYSHGKLRLTAWRPTFPIWIHISGLNIYKYFHQDSPVLLTPHDAYFITYGILLQLIYAVLFILSLYYFYTIAYSLLQSHILSNFCLVAYIFNPAALYYIGVSPAYENIAICSIVILVGFYFKKLDADKTSFFELMFVIFLSILSCLIRPQTLLIITSLLANLLVFVIAKYRAHKQGINILYAIILNIVLLLVVHIPIIVKNYRLFDNFLLSTQSGFEFLQGHNPFARGAWNGLCYKGTPFDDYVRSQIPKLDLLNEYEEGEARKKLAFKWIKENPVKEVWLISRKIAMFFLPDNYLYEKQFFNVASIYNLLFFVAFIAAVIFYLLNILRGRTSINSLEKYIILLVPVIIPILLSVIFYFGHRWRYYAEPFMMIIAFSYLNHKMKISRLNSNILKQRMFN